MHVVFAPYAPCLYHLRTYRVETFAVIQGSSLSHNVFCHPYPNSTHYQRDTSLWSLYNFTTPGLALLGCCSIMNTSYIIPLVGQSLEWLTARYSTGVNHVWSGCLCPFFFSLSRNLYHVGLISISSIPNTWLSLVSCSSFFY